MKKTVGFLDLETNEASDDITSDFEEGVSELLMDSDWTAILVDKHKILFLKESTGVKKTNDMEYYLLISCLWTSCYCWLNKHVHTAVHRTRTC